MDPKVIKSLEKEFLLGEKYLNNAERLCTKLIELIKQQKVVNAENLRRLKEAESIQAKDEHIEVSVILEKGVLNEIVDNVNKLVQFINSYAGIYQELEGNKKKK